VEYKKTTRKEVDQDIKQYGSVLIANVRIWQKKQTTFTSHLIMAFTRPA